MYAKLILIVVNYYRTRYSRLFCHPFKLMVIPPNLGYRIWPRISSMDSLIEFGWKFFLAGLYNFNMKTVCSWFWSCCGFSLLLHFLHLQKKFQMVFIPFEMWRGRIGRLRNGKFLGEISMNLKGWRNNRKNLVQYWWYWLVTGNGFYPNIARCVAWLSVRRGLSDRQSIRSQDCQFRFSFFTSRCGYGAGLQRTGRSWLSFLAVACTWTFATPHATNWHSQRSLSTAVNVSP